MIFHHNAKSSFAGFLCLGHVGLLHQCVKVKKNVTSCDKLAVPIQNLYQNHCLEGAKGLT